MSLKCVACEEEITYLAYKQTAVIINDCSLYVDKDGIAESTIDERQYMNEEEYDFKCPHCGDLIAHKRDLAEKFLKGEVV